MTLQCALGAHWRAEVEVGFEFPLHLRADGFLADQLTLGDIAIAVMFANLKWARVELDNRRWPKTLAWVERSTATPGLARVTQLAERLMRTPAAQHRATLAEMGVALTATTLAAAAPRPGLMPLG